MGTGSSKLSGGSGGGGVSGIPINPTELSDEEALALKDQYESGFDSDTKDAVSKYISRADFDGDGHSMSQVMNYLVAEGIDLDKTTTAEIYDKLGVSLTRSQLEALRKTNDSIDAAMHPIGKDVILQRGCHQDDLRRLFGIDDYTKLSEAELQSRLVGGTFVNKAVMSTSYNVDVNPFLGRGSGSGGRELVYNIKASAKTPMVWGAISQSEAVIGKGTKWKITGVHFTGKTARPRSSFGKELPQIQIDIETY